MPWTPELCLTTFAAKLEPEERREMKLLAKFYFTKICLKRNRDGNRTFEDRGELRMFLQPREAAVQAIRAK